MKKIFPCMLLFLNLASCGGGGADQGLTPAQALTVSPQALTLNGNGTTCPSGTVDANFYITGGVPPYSVKPSLPDVMVLSTQSVSDAGGYFTLLRLNSATCLNPGTVVVEDMTGAVVDVTITTTPSS